MTCLDRQREKESVIQKASNRCSIDPNMHTHCGDFGRHYIRLEQGDRDSHRLNVGDYIIANYVPYTTPDYVI